MNLISNILPSHIPYSNPVIRDTHRLFSNTLNHICETISQTNSKLAVNNTGIYLVR